MKRLTFSIILLTALINLIAGFPEIMISSDFNSRPFFDLINDVENKYKLKFFYLEEWISDITVIQATSPCPLDKILEESLQNTDLSYFYDEPGNIIFTSKYKIESSVNFSNLKETPKTINEFATPEESSYITKSITKVVVDGDSEKIVTIGIPGNLSSRTSKAVLSGYVREKETGNPVPGAVVYVKDFNVGTITDLYGYYVLSIPPGNHELLFKFLGRKEEIVKVLINGNGMLDVEMEEKMIELWGVVITADKEHNVRGLQLGLDKLDIQTIKYIPSTLGEADVIKSTLLLPGVQTVGEGAGGFNVRGGNTDQNLILMDGAPLFNSSHVFGFFSVFNPDIVSDFKLYKSGVPAKYGGRLSSVMDVSLRNGDLKKICFDGGISPVAARFSIDGPVIKDKATFLISGRGSHSDWILHNVDVAALKNSTASFYDINVKLNYKIHENNEISFSSYYSGDRFKLNYDTLYNYVNMNAALTYKHVFSGKLYNTLSAIYSNYGYSLKSESMGVYAFDLNYNVQYKEARTDFTWFLNTNHKINFGANVIKYGIQPGDMGPLGLESIILPVHLQKEQALETGIYLNDEHRISDKLLVSYGIRHSGFLTLGPLKVYHYQEGAPRSLLSRVDSTIVNESKIINDTWGLEPRFSARYITGPSSSLKINISKMYQYLHMLSNTTAISPTDIWKVSGPNLPSRKSWQYSAGFYKDLLSNTMEASLELYYKTSKDILEYRGGTNLLMNPDLEIDLLKGIGKAYGMEIMFKRNYGALNGWASYTFSRSLVKVDSEHLIDRINQGKYFPSNYDKPHDFTFVINYRFSRRHSISNTITYSTGRPITYPVGKYQFRNRELIHYSNRNEYRIPDYFRWDISLNIDGNLKSKRLIRDSVSISLYNLTGRNNVYSIFFVSDITKKVQGYKLSVFAQPILSLTYNFKY